jgi:hypothetical protein
MLLPALRRGSCWLAISLPSRNATSNGVAEQPDQANDATDDEEHHQENSQFNDVAEKHGLRSYGGCACYGSLAT